MYRKILITAAVAMSFALPAFAATTAKPAPKPRFYVEMVGGVCSVTPTAVTPAPTLTAPDKLEGSKKGYATLKAANSELAKLVKAKTCKTA